MSLAWKQTRITSSIDSSSIHGLVVTAAVALAITKMMRLTFKSSGSSRANDGGDDYEQRIISGDCPTKSHRPLLGGRGLVSREMSLPFVVVVVAVLVCLATTPLASGQLYGECVRDLELSHAAEEDKLTGQPSELCSWKRLIYCCRYIVY